MLEVLEPQSLSLSELAERANSEHREVERLAGEAVRHAILSGDALLAAQTQVDGSWVDWVERNFIASNATAQLYMRLARHQDRILTEDPPPRTIPQALLLVRTRTGLGPYGYPNEIREEAVRLARSGLSYKDAAEAVGVCTTTVHKWVNPKLAARRKENQRRLARRTQREQERARKQAETRRAAKRVGGPEDAALSHARQMLGVLQQGYDEATGPRRQALRRALTAAYEVTDAIGDAARERYAESA